MSFFLVMRQKGNGCDYMIGCGMKYVHLKADNMSDARHEAAKEHHANDKGDTLEESLILQVGEIVDLLDGDEGNQSVTAKEYRALKKKIEKLRAKNESLKETATCKTMDYAVLAEAMKGIFGESFMDRVKMKHSTYGFTSDVRVNSERVTSGDIFTKALDERASQLVAPKMSAKKKMAKDAIARAEAMEGFDSRDRVVSELLASLERIAK